MSDEYWKSYEIARLREALRVQDKKTSEAWSEATSIPAGCGCTPFYADARRESERLVQMCHDFIKLAGRKKFREIGLRQAIFELTAPNATARFRLRKSRGERL